MSLPIQIAFMTGQSDPESCALSPAQAAFLDRLAIPEAARVNRNFPYADQTPPYRDVSLAAASWQNMRQYLVSRTPAFAAAHRPAVVRMLARADHTVLLAGSCGLEILANLELPGPVLQGVHVFAYGPVARHRPACDTVVVRGGGDWIARAWGGHVDHLVEGGHMGYLANEDVAALCQTFVARVARLAGVTAP
ncbi:MAG: hypothetical protein NTY02_04950 [Acidobacteria bacterium]|nr:hypothetical protein [Acidobacteriota bacterium]